MKQVAGAVATGLSIVVLAWFGWPRPLGVDLSIIQAVPLVVTVDEEAKTRVRHVYTVSAPVAGKVLRTARHVGDEVVVDETIIAVLEPMRPGFHDARTHQELEGASAAAEAAVKLAEAEVRRITAALEFSRNELRRARVLIKTEAISPKALDRAMFDARTKPL
jgi:HlyD family secretion protein